MTVTWPSQCHHCAVTVTLNLLRSAEQVRPRRRELDPHLEPTLVQTITSARADCWMQPCAAGHLKYFATIRHLRERRGSLDWLPRPRPDDSGSRRHRADLSWSVGPPSPQEFCKRHWQRRVLELTHRLGRLLSGSVLKLGAFQFQRAANLNAALPNTSRTLKPAVHLTGCHWHRGTRVNFKPKQKQFLA